jgi:hypothetical protein
MEVNYTNNSDIEVANWEILPVTNEVAKYLNKPDITMLSQICRYYRIKLSERLFYQLTLSNQTYKSYREVNSIKLRRNKLKLVACSQIVKDLAFKVRHVKKVVLNSKINTEFANLFFANFNQVRTVVIDCKYDFKISVVYAILKHLKYLEVLYMESITEKYPDNSLPPINFKLPITLKSIYCYPCLIEKGYFPAINDIDFNTYRNLNSWQITGRFNTGKFEIQQCNIVHLYLRDIPMIEPTKFKLILASNYQLKTLTYEVESWNVEKLNNILSLPNLSKLRTINYSFDTAEYTGFSLITNTSIKTLIIEHGTSIVIIEELLTKLKSLKDLIFVNWNLCDLSNIDWIKYKERFNCILFGFSYWFGHHMIEDKFGCLIPNTKIIFDKRLEKIINYDLSI